MSAAVTGGEVLRESGFPRPCVPCRVNFAGIDFVNDRPRVAAETKALHLSCINLLHVLRGTMPHGPQS